MQSSRRKPPRSGGATGARGGARAGGDKDNGTDLALAELAPFMRRAAQDRDAQAAAVGEGDPTPAAPAGAPAKVPGRAARSGCTWSIRRLATSRRRSRR